MPERTPLPIGNNLAIPTIPTAQLGTLTRTTNPTGIDRLNIAMNNQWTPPTPTVVGAGTIQNTAPTTSVPLPTPEQVFSPGNVSATFSNPTQAPDLSDPFQLRDSFFNTPELLAAKNNLLNTQNQINQVNQGLRTTTTALENQNTQARGGTGASMNLIGTQVGRARDLTSNELAALGETLQGQQSLYSSLKEEAEAKHQIAREQQAEIRSLIASTKGQAGITITDDLETALQKAYDWEKKEDKRIKVQALIDQTGGKAGILETDAYEVAQKKVADWEKKEQKKLDEKNKKEAEEKEKKELQSQIKALGGKTKTKNGGTMNLKQLREEYQKLTGEQYKKEQQRDDEEWAMKVAEHNKSTNSAPGANKELLAVADAYKKFGGNWDQTAEYLAGLGYDVSSGSTIDNELRRRKGLDPIGTGIDEETAYQEWLKMQ